MRKVQVVVMSVLAVCLFGGCMATRKFVRNEVKTLGDALGARIDTANGEIKATQDSVTAANQRISAADQRITQVDNSVKAVDTRVSGVDQKVSGVDSRLTDLDSRTTQGMNSLRADISSANQKIDANARTTANLEQRFKNRNTYEISVSKAVQFRFDSATLNDAGKSPLDEVAQFLQDNPEAIVVLEGHTDNSGDASYNMALGQRRIEVVRRYLAIEKAVPIYKIEEISYGEDKPITGNEDRAGREQNRAVNVRVLVPLSSASASN